MNTIFTLLGKIAIQNTEANKKIDDTVGKAKKSSNTLQTNLTKIGSAAVKVVGTITAVAGAVGGMLINLADNTRDYRVEMGKMVSAFDVNGHSAETAKTTYKALQSVLGDTSKAAEAASVLSRLASNEQDLKTWTDICTGVYATFGDSLPISGLAEAADKTAKYGKVTGDLEDVLLQAGISEADFNNKLSGCTSEQERQRLIMDTLNGTYKTASDRYKTINKDIIASNTAHDNLNAAMAGLGAAAEPAVTVIVNACAKLAEAATPVVKALSDAVLWLADAWETLKTTMTDISAKVTVYTSGVKAAAANEGVAVTEKTGSSFLGSLAETLINSFSVNPDAPWFPHASGLRYVPFDGYRSLLHVGEAVLPRHEADEYRSGKGSSMNTDDLKAEIRALSDRVAGFMQQIAMNTAAGHQVVLDSGALVGRLTPQIDAQMGTITMRKQRRNL